MSKIDRRMTDKKFSQVSRRELLKLAPVLALGAFAIPKLQQGLLKKGLGFSDWASARLFRPGHLATTFDNAELTPFEKFPINGYDVDDPGVIFENWNLTVSGAVKKIDIPDQFNVIALYPIAIVKGAPNADGAAAFTAAATLRPST